MSRALLVLIVAAALACKRDAETEERSVHEEKIVRTVESCGVPRPEDGRAADGGRSVSETETEAPRPAPPFCHGSDPCIRHRSEDGRCFVEPVPCHPGFGCDPRSGECEPVRDLACEESGGPCFDARWNGSAGLCELTPKIADECVQEPACRGGGERAKVDCDRAARCMVETYRADENGRCVASYLGPTDGCAETRTDAEPGCFVVENPGPAFDDGDPCTSEEAVVCRASTLSRFAEDMEPMLPSESLTDRVMRFLRLKRGAISPLPNPMRAYAHLAAAGWGPSCRHAAGGETVFERFSDSGRHPSCRREDAVSWPGGCAYPRRFPVECR